MIYPTIAELMNFVSDEKNQFLFHYTKYSSALEILLGEQMRLGSLVNMNDPLEFENHHGEPITFHGNPPNELLSSWILDKENAVTEKETVVRLASFSIDQKSSGKYDNFLFKGWARSRMWAQYADNHKGVCLVFDKINLINNFKKAFNYDYCETFCKEVKYTNNLTPLKNALSSNPPCKSLITFDKIDFLFQKCEDFRDEQEFRFLLINKKLNDTKEIVSFSIADSLCGVITGAKFPNENILTLKKAIKCSNPNIKLFPLWWDYGMPNILFAL